MAEQLVTEALLILIEPRAGEKKINQCADKLLNADKTGLGIAQCRLEEGWKQAESVL